VSIVLKVEKITENNKQSIVDFLRTDIIKHVFAFYDIHYEPEHTTMHVAFEDKTPRGYVLFYTALEFPSVILECEGDIAEKLIEYAPKNHFVMHAPPGLLPLIKRKYPNAKCYVEDWMLVKKDSANFVQSELVRRLKTRIDASRLLTLLSTREDRSTEPEEKYAEQISRMPYYGVFIDGELVSYASSFLQLPQVWMIGGVYTHPKHRDKGYATLATSAVTEEALKNAQTAALFARKDNYPAIRAYENVGYKKIGEKVWVDVGIGRKP
jgi:RimJ/RimL family protein N-acetyltransferase